MSQLKDFFTLFNGLQLPVGNLGVSRSQMPQIPDNRRAAFFQFLGSQGITVENEEVWLRELKLTQAEINKVKILRLMRMLRKEGLNNPIFVSSDYYVLDGSHRFVSELNIDKRGTMRIHRIGMKMLDLLRLVRQFPGVQYRTYSDTKVGT